MNTINQDGSYDSIAIAAVVLTKEMPIQENMAAGLSKGFYIIAFHDIMIKYKKKN